MEEVKTLRPVEAQMCTDPKKFNKQSTDTTAVFQNHVHPIKV